MNLAAGDGRFNNTLLKHSDHVIASDNDERALNKLVRLTSSELKNKLKIEKFDLTKEFPFPDSSFDGCFCAATLHIFAPSSVQFIISEITRVTVPSGHIIIDFCTNTRRTLPDGNLYIYPGETSYSTEQGRALLQKCFESQNYDLCEDELGPDKISIGTHCYVYTSHCLLLICKVQK